MLSFGVQSLNSELVVAIRDDDLKAFHLRFCPARNRSVAGFVAVFFAWITFVSWKPLYHSQPLHPNLLHGIGVSDGIFNTSFTAYVFLLTALLFGIFTCFRERVLLAASVFGQTLGLLVRLTPSLASSIREVKIVLYFLATVASLGLLISSFQASKAANSGA
jgi:hypothetical protein